MSEDKQIRKHIDPEEIHNKYSSKSLEKRSETRKPKFESVLKTPAKKVEKSVLSRVADSIIVEGIKSVGTYLFFDVFVPKTKELLVDMVGEGLTRTFFGEASSPRRSYRHSGDRRRYTDYSSLTRSRSYDYGGPGNTRAISNRIRKNYSFEEILINTRVEAEEVLDRMQDSIDHYGECTVGDLFDLTGITQEYTDDKYGWTHLGDSKIIRVRDGYALDLIPPVLLKR